MNLKAPMQIQLAYTNYQDDWVMSMENIQNKKFDIFVATPQCPKISLEAKTKNICLHLPSYVTLVIVGEGVSGEVSLCSLNSPVVDPEL